MVFQNTVVGEPKSVSKYGMPMTQKMIRSVAP